jgi:ubiquinone/menaquinone biosynthesis C-methylase UbiE
VNESSDRAPTQGIDARETAQTRARYDRAAHRFDEMEARVEPRFARWRAMVWSLVQGPEVLDIGVGTGKNMPYYPPHVHVTGVDLSAGMLALAHQRARELGLAVDLIEMDAQSLGFPDATFDSAVATFVFCAIPDPLLGLREMVRVVKPGGRILLVEHVRSPHPIWGPLMGLLDPLMMRVLGDHFGRQTVDYLRRMPVFIERVEDLWLGGIFKLIVARKATVGAVTQVDDEQARL